MRSVWIQYGAMDIGLLCMRTSPLYPLAPLLRTQKCRMPFTDYFVNIMCLGRETPYRPWFNSRKHLAFRLPLIISCISVLYRGIWNG
ncbi:hypothetical protein D3C76_1229710 [compost metagenome]